MSKSLTFITSNPTKAEQLSLHLGAEVGHRAIDLAEVQSLNLAEVVEYKVRAAFDIVQGPVLVEDMALVCNALGKLPGPLIKWFFQELGSDGLCRLLNNYEDRSAKAMVLFGHYDGQSLKTYSGEIDGTIALSPRGESAFPSDTIFIPSGSGRTWAEMTADEQSATSIRRIALKKLEADLDTVRAQS